MGMLKEFLIKHHVLRELYYQMDGIPSKHIPIKLILIYSISDYMQQKNWNILDRLLQRLWDKYYPKFIESYHKEHGIS
jgi:hypothetical protein